MLSYIKSFLFKMASQAPVRRKPVPPLIQHTHEPQYVLPESATTPVNIVSPENPVTDRGHDGQAHYSSDAVESYPVKPFTVHK